MSEAMKFKDLLDSLSSDGEFSDDLISREDPTLV